MTGTVVRTENFEDAINAATGVSIDIINVRHLNGTHSLIETSSHGSFVCESFIADNFVVDDVFTKVFKLKLKE